MTFRSLWANSNYLMNIERKEKNVPDRQENTHTKYKGLEERRNIRQPGS